VADVDVVLGYLNPDNFLGGRLRLNRDLARRAIEEHIARPLGMSVEQAAEGIKTIVDSRMADEVRQVTIQQGCDPSDFALMAYGGAGPTHAFSYGAELGMSEIIVPVTASVHSAFGIHSSDLTAVEEVSHPLQSPPGSTDYAAALPTQRLNEIFGELDRRVLGRFSGAGIDPADCRLTRFIEMRFRFQIHALTVPVPELPLDAPAIDQLVGRFIDLYEARFGKGSAFKAAGVELTTFRVVAKATSGRPDLRHHEADGRVAPTSVGRRDVFQNGAWTTASIIEGSALRPGMRLDGLAIVELLDTTIVVGAGQQATVDAIGNIVLRLHS
jgi:N-methylhydantoinase A